MLLSSSIGSTGASASVKHVQDLRSQGYFDCASEVRASTPDRNNDGVMWGFSAGKSCFKAPNPSDPAQPKQPKETPQDGQELSAPNSRDWSMVNKQIQSLQSQGFTSCSSDVHAGTPDRSSNGLMWGTSGGKSCFKAPTGWTSSPANFGQQDQQDQQVQQNQDFSNPASAYTTGVLQRSASKDSTLCSNDRYCSHFNPDIGQVDQIKKNAPMIGRVISRGCSSSFPQGGKSFDQCVQFKTVQAMAESKGDIDYQVSGKYVFTAYMILQDARNAHIISAQGVLGTFPILAV